MENGLRRCVSESNRFPTRIVSLSFPVLLIDREPPMLSVHEHVVERQVQ
jgi:hypothetical protein